MDVEVFMTILCVYSAIMGTVSLIMSIRAFIKARKSNNLNKVRKNRIKNNSNEFTIIAI